MESPQSSVTDIQVSYASLQGNLKELVKMCSANNRAHAWNSILNQAPNIYTQNGKPVNYSALHGFSPRKILLPWGAPTTRKYTSTSYVINPAQDNNEGDSAPKPYQTLDFSTHHKPLDHLSTRREMNMVDCQSSGWVQKCLWLMDLFVHPLSQGP